MADGVSRYLLESPLNQAAVGDAKSVQNLPHDAARLQATPELVRLP